MTHIKELTLSASLPPPYCQKSRACRNFFTLEFNKYVILALCNGFL